MKEADVLTISALQPADGAFPKEYGKMIFRNEQYSGVDSLAALKGRLLKHIEDNLALH